MLEALSGLASVWNTIPYWSIFLICKVRPRGQKRCVRYARIGRSSVVVDSFYHPYKQGEKRGIQGNQLWTRSAPRRPVGV